MQFPEGENFRTAAGSLTFSEFGELVSETWAKAHPSAPMYPIGTPSDEMTYPNVTWACANKKRMNAAKDRTTDEFFDGEGGSFTKRIGEYRCVLEVRISAESPLEANQLVEAFERFMQQYTGAFKQAGARELLYLERLPDSFEKINATTISHRTLQYEMHEQISTVTGGALIEFILLKAKAFTDDAPVIESQVGPTSPTP